MISASSTQGIVTITQMDPITVIFTLPEDNLDQVQAEMRKQKSLPVDALDRAQQKKIASGKLLTIDNQIDTTTGTVKLRANFNNKDGALLDVEMDLVPLQVAENNRGFFRVTGRAGFIVPSGIATDDSTTACTRIGLSAFGRIARNSA